MPSPKTLARRLRTDEDGQILKRQVGLPDLSDVLQLKFAFHVKVFCFSGNWNLHLDALV